MFLDERKEVNDCNFLNDNVKISPGNIFLFYMAFLIILFITSVMLQNYYLSFDFHSNHLSVNNLRCLDLSQYSISLAGYK